jgi:predicted acetyltransferase
VANAYSYRTAREDDWSDIVLLLSEAFIEDSTDEWAEIEHGVFEPDRTVLAETETGEKAGVSSAFTRDLITPGGVVPAAHVTMVSVSSLHRRRGILTNMISRLHDEGLRRKEPVAVLWASEGRIYQRFGYGLGALRHRLEIDLSETEFRPDARPAGDGSLRKGSMADLDSLIKVYDQVFRDRPGWSSRDERWWTYVTSDPKEGRNGATAQRITLHEGPDGVDGYMLWRAKAEWNSPTAAGAVIVRELTAANPEAYRALWQHAMSVDLTRNVVLRMGATDEPLTSLLTEPRAMGARAMDSLWVRILSVPEALAARRYAAPIDVVLDVADRDFPDNNRRWRLIGSPDTASCAPTDDPADLSLDIATLSSAYLGGPTLGALGAGGRVRERKPGALATASIAFGWHRQPSAIESF